MLRFILVTILAVAAVTDFSTPSAAQQPFCNRGRACVPVTQATYNSPAKPPAMPERIEAVLRLRERGNG
jgi:hypothetical protein